MWFIPALALQFVLATMAAALRGSGAFRTPMIVQVVTVAINIVLAPFLIFGWGTGAAFGVEGAAIASLVAIAVGVAWLTVQFLQPDAFLRFTAADAPPRPAAWGRLLAIGLPAGAEFSLMAVYMFLVLVVARPFGSAAQAGFGIGLRLVQALFLPVVALAFSAAPVAGQNVGARRFDRVRQTLFAALGLTVGLMLIVAVVCQFAAAALVGVFSADPAVIGVGADYLRIISWGFACSGIVFVSSSIFQALGRTIPPLADLVPAQRRGVRAGPVAGGQAGVRPQRDLVPVASSPSWSTPPPTSCSCSARSSSRRRDWFPDRHAFAVP